MMIRTLALSFTTLAMPPASAHAPATGGLTAPDIGELAQLCEGGAVGADIERISACDAALRLERGKARRADLLTHRGWLRQNIDQDEPAMADFDAALTLVPDHFGALRGRGVMLSDAGDLPGALATFDRTIARHRKHGPLYIDRAVVLEKMGETVRARIDLDMAVALDPSNARGRSARARLLQLSGAHEAALADLAAAIDAEPGMQAYRYRRGIVLLALNAPRRALVDFDAAIQMDARAPHLWTQRARAFEALGRHDIALRNYEMALRIAPHDETALSGKALLLQAPGGVEEAIATRATAAATASPLAALDAAIELDRFDIRALVRRAQLLVGQPNRHAQARQDLATALWLSPGQPQALLQRARLGNVTGAYGDALADAEAVLARDGRQIEALFQRGRAQAGLGDKVAAVDSFTRALQIAPENRVILFNRAVLRRELGQVQAALADVDAALRLEPRDADVLGWRAALLRSLERIGEAVADYRAALAVAPGRVDLTLGLTQVLALDPDPAPVSDGRAVMLQRRGETAEAGVSRP